VGVSEGSACRVWVQASMWLKGLLLHQREERGTTYVMVCTQLRTQMDLMVCTQLLLLWLNFRASSCHQDDDNKTTGCLLACLQGVADPLPGNDVNRIKSNLQKALLIHANTCCTSVCKFLSAGQKSRLQAPESSNDQDQADGSV
jgi:hypothetical protein